MTPKAAPVECPPQELAELVGYLQSGPADADRKVASALAAYPGDGRLQFVYGSMLAGARRYEEARQAIAQAVILSPYLWIARFQLGLLELTSGLPAEAANTWRPLHELAADNPLRVFATGLEALIVDDFNEAVRRLREGIGLNSENPPLNRDMEMLIERIQEVADGSQGEGPVSATQLLLQTIGRTRH